MRLVTCALFCNSTFRELTIELSCRKKVPANERVELPSSRGLLFPIFSTFDRSFPLTVALCLSFQKSTSACTYSESQGLSLLNTTILRNSRVSYTILTFTRCLSLKLTTILGDFNFSSSERFNHSRWQLIVDHNERPNRTCYSDSSLSFWTRRYDTAG